MNSQFHQNSTIAVDNFIRTYKDPSLSILSLIDKDRMEKINRNKAILGSVLCWVKKLYGLSTKALPILPIVFFRHKRSLPISLKILVAPLQINDNKNDRLLLLYLFNDYAICLRTA
jgi:hypothetical protein